MGLTMHVDMRGKEYETTYRSYIIEKQEEADFIALLYRSDEKY
jgi:hypothetical protein